MHLESEDERVAAALRAAPEPCSTQFLAGAFSPIACVSVACAVSRMARPRLSVEPPPYHVPISRMRSTSGREAISLSAMPKEVPFVTCPCAVAWRAGGTAKQVRSKSRGGGGGDSKRELVELANAW